MGENDKDKDQALPWVFTVTPPAGTAQAGVDPATAVYRLFAYTRNPFLRRVLAPLTKQAGGGTADVQRLFRLLVDRRQYQSGPENVGEPLRRRQLEHIRSGPPEVPRFQEPRILPGDPRRLPALVSSFFQNVLDRLRQQPNSFFEVVDEVRELLAEYEIRIRITEAFREFEDWEHFMETLVEISRYPAPETFDLFCSALLAYNDLANDEEA